jgi:hypothetical protein
MKLRLFDGKNRWYYDEIAAVRSTMVKVELIKV